MSCSNEDMLARLFGMAEEAWSNDEHLQASAYLMTMAHIIGAYSPSYDDWRDKVDQQDKLLQSVIDRVGGQ